MTDVKEFFETLPARAGSSGARGLSNSYLFDVEGAGQWLVEVDEGEVRVTEGGEGADVTIATNEETFRRLVAREQSPVSAYMTGKLRITGDMGAAMRLQQLF